jgi:hypothetical protein
MNLSKKSSLILFIIILSCSDKNNLFEFKKETISLKENIIVSNNNNESVDFDFGLWMFNNKEPDADFIANWINVKLEGKRILEPINVLWVDYKAKNKAEAIKNITSFLFSNGFLIRSGSSTGYYAFFDNNNWIHQYEETWSNKKNPNTINNHGRVFLAHEVKSNLNNPVFLSSGAFSIESERHFLISFDTALKQLNEVNEWTIFDNSYKAKNITSNYAYTTFDHKGVKIFILN